MRNPFKSKKAARKAMPKKPATTADATAASPRDPPPSPAPASHATPAPAQRLLPPTRPYLAGLCSRMLHPDILTHVLAQLPASDVIPLLEVADCFVHAAAPSLFRRLCLPEDWLPLLRRTDGTPRPAHHVALLMRCVKEIHYTPHAQDAYGDWCRADAALPALPPGSVLRVASRECELGRWALSPGQATYAKLPLAMWSDDATCACMQRVDAAALVRSQGCVFSDWRTSHDGTALSTFAPWPQHKPDAVEPPVDKYTTRMLVLYVVDGALHTALLGWGGGNSLNVTSVQPRAPDADAVMHQAVGACCDEFAALPLRTVTIASGTTTAGVAGEVAAALLARVARRLVEAGRDGAAVESVLRRADVLDWSRVHELAYWSKVMVPIARRLCPGVE